MNRKSGVRLIQCSLIVLTILLVTNIALIPQLVLAETPPSDNITPESPLSNDDIIPETLPGDNITPESPLSNDDTIPETLPGDNITPEAPSPPAEVSSDDTGKQAQIESITKGNPKLDSVLNRLAEENLAAGPTPLLTMGAPRAVENTIRVIIESVTNQVNEIATAASAFGNIEASYGDLIQVVMSVSQLTALAEVPNIHFMRMPQSPLTTVTTEGADVINADAWLAATYNGTGIKIGILDVGFSGYTTRVSEGELPTPVSTWWAPSIGDAGTNVHGTACAEIVYDIAPEADFYLANFNTEVEYGNAVEWLIEKGVDIISCSVAWPTGGPGDGTGTICQIVDYAKDHGIFWVQAVGNQAERHWQGDWYNTDGDAYHNFASTDEGNTITVNSGGTITAALKWDDTWGASANDYDLFLFDNSANLVAYSLNTQDGDDDPWEALSYTATYSGTYSIAIWTQGAPAAVNFHLYSYYHNLQYQTASSSFLVPADSFTAVAVGAVNYSTPTTLESFSSLGPTDDGRVKPDLVAPDGVSTMSYSSYTPPTFSGTSASAPHVAGAAALVKERFPTYTPAQIWSFLEGRAVDLGSTGKDNYFGSGRLDLGTASDNFTLTIAVIGEGTVIPAAGAHSYSTGTVVTINATAEAGWQFTEWTGDVANPSSANTTVTMDSDKTVTANFIMITSNWSTNSNINTLVCNLGDGTNQQIISDESAGAIVTWQDKRSGNWAIYAQRLSSSGSTLWASNGILISSEGEYPQLVSNGSGGAIIVWAGGGIHAQRIDASGNILWTANGITVSDSGLEPQIASDGSGGTIIVWAGGGIHAQRIDASGNILWTANGITVSDSGLEPQIASDGSGGAIVAWKSGHVETYDIYAGKIDALGNILWAIPICTAVGEQFKHQILPDDSGGAFITWCDWRGANYNIYAQRVNTSGNILWTFNGVAICTADDHQETPKITSDGSGGAIITWEDGRNSSILNAYAQRISSLGSCLWAPNGVRICPSNNGHTSLQIIPDSADGVIITWQHNDGDDPRNIYAQRINSSGGTLWITTGVEIATAANYQSWPQMTSDGYGGAIITWQDKRGGGGYDIYAQQVSHEGLLGDTSGNTLLRDLSMSIDGSGSITPAIGSHRYPLNSTVDITATPAANWAFVNWTGNVTDNTSPSTTILMDTNKTVTANFNRVNSILKMVTSGSGSVTPAPGNHTYPIGEKVDITAIPATNWEFACWEGDVADTNYNSTNVTMNWDKTITANFNRVAGTLTMSVSGSGSVTPAVGSHTYTVGDIVDITATPAAGWRFVNWMGDVGTVDDVNSASTNVTMNSDYSITANFSDQATLTMSVSGSGSVTPAVGSHTYTVGDIVNITATPASGWQFSSWTGDVANAISATTTVTMNTDKTITANFSQVASTPSSSGGGGGGGGGGLSGLTSLLQSVTQEGRFVEDIKAVSGDKKVDIFIPKNTIGKNRMGSLLTSLWIKEKEDRPAPPLDAKVIGLVYDIYPSGATFNPPIPLTFKYDISQIPEGCNECNLTIATWDQSSSQWLHLESQVDPENDTISTQIAHLSLYTVMAGTRPAEFSVTDLSITPSEIIVGESANVSVIVSSTGDLSGRYEVTLEVNNIAKQTKEITLAGGDNVTVSFKLIGENSGTYITSIAGLQGTLTVLPAALPSLASFKISSLTISPNEVDIGEKVDISVTVTNTGESAGSYEVVLKINGIIADTKEVPVEAGATEVVTFTTSLDTAGKKIIDVNGLIGGLVVLGAVPPPAQIPLPLEGSEPATESKIFTPTPQPTPPAEPAPTLESNWWLILIIAASGCGILATLLLYFTWWRKRDTQVKKPDSR